MKLAGCTDAGEHERVLMHLRGLKMAARKIKLLKRKYYRYDVGVGFMVMEV